MNGTAQTKAATAAAIAANTGSPEAAAAKRLTEMSHCAG